ncbi:hypothetical protein Tco_1540362 [Tanacetum coccineum]
MRARPTTLVESFSLAHLIEARFEAIAEKEKEQIMNEIAKKEQIIKEKADTTLSFPSEEASLEAKESLDVRPVDKVRGKFAKFSIDKGYVKKILSAT